MGWLFSQPRTCKKLQFALSYWSLLVGLVLHLPAQDHPLSLWQLKRIHVPHFCSILPSKEISQVRKCVCLIIYYLQWWNKNGTFVCSLFAFEYILPVRNNLRKKVWSWEAVIWASGAFPWLLFLHTLPAPQLRLVPVSDGYWNRPLLLQDIYYEFVMASFLRGKNV